MRLVLVGILLLLPCLAQAQEPEPMVIYGYAFMDSGDSVFVRLEFSGAPENSVVRLAPFGQTPVDFPDVSIAPDTAWIAFTWPDREYHDCHLLRRAEFHWQGTCRSAGAARVISLGGGYQPDLGQRREPSQIDVQILIRARSILASSRAWNRKDERICVDDERTARVSLFCALYLASVEVDGSYLHSRAAMRAVRTVITDIARARISFHILVDFNNHPDTSFAEVLQVLDAARTRIESAIRASGSSSSQIRLRQPGTAGSEP
ncbi:MAG: DUF6197 family protein [Acidobacteriota bacterium]